MFVAYASNNVLGTYIVVIRMPRWCPGGITATRSPQWPIVQFWLTTIRGITRIYHGLDR